jgi:hypothetical protein
MDSDVDPEFAAMRLVAATLEPLDDEARARVMTWVNQKYSFHPSGGRLLGPTRSAPQSERDFPDLFGAADPRSDEEYALAAAYWVSKYGGVQDMDAQTLNSMLKDLGYPVANITRTLGRLQARRPALVRQVQKAGTSKQARKKYRLTGEGARAFEEMLSGRHLNPED